MEGGRVIWMWDRESGRFEYIGSVDDCSFMRHSPSCSALH
jgi:hypothetical protein